MNNILSIYSKILTESDFYSEENFFKGYEKDSFGMYKNLTSDDDEDDISVRLDTIDNGYRATLNLNGTVIISYQADDKIKAIQGMSNEARIICRKLENAVENMF